MHDHVSNPIMPRHAIAAWLIGVEILILLMVMVGGITRLTGSGLSMVEWQPIMGTLPPRSPAQWEDVFEKYKAYPEYQLINKDMDLGAFKNIFFWEYTHRLLGRLMGAAFFLPFLYFLARRRLHKPLAIKLGVAFLLGGGQGVLGWFMVKSGLVDNPHVSHYRLAAHLGLAFLVFSYILWILCDLFPPAQASPDPNRRRSLARGSWLLTALISLQIVYGAFVAGLRAGYAYNTFPLMMGGILPPGFLGLEPGWVNFLRNAATVQFTHRSLGWAVLIAVFALWWWALRGGNLTRRQHHAFHLLLGLVSLQFILGVITLLLVVPVFWATFHQVNACLLLGASVFLNHSCRT